jgi:hypothetical protein
LKGCRSHRYRKELYPISSERHPLGASLGDAKGFQAVIP